MKCILPANVSYFGNAFLPLASLCLGSLPLNAVVEFDGVLDDTRTATDGTGEFYYDYFQLTNETGAPLTISDGDIVLDAGPNMQPWFGIWDYQALPADDWVNPVNYMSSRWNIISPLIMELRFLSFIG